MATSRKTPSTTSRSSKRWNADRALPARTLVIGATGQLGQDIVRVFAESGDFEVQTAARSKADFALDLNAPASIHEVIEKHSRPRIVINTAAAHNVPLCESGPEEAWRVNATGVAALARASTEVSARLIHISTDYVFGAQPRKDVEGTSSPWLEHDLPAPLNVYGASKLAGEHLLAAACEDYAIVRSSGLYGRSPCLAKGGHNFVKQMLHLGEERGEVTVVTDEVSTPTSTLRLAHQIRTLALSEAQGIFHATCQGSCSWNEFATAIFEESNQPIPVLPAKSADFPSPVRRPAYSVLENRRLQELGLDIMPHWRDALREYLRSISSVDS